MLRFLPVLSVLALALAARAKDTDWPPPAPESRPWVRWWWPGNGVDEASLATQLEQIAGAGFGGVEVSPSPAMAEAADLSLEWLGPAWVERLSAAAEAAAKAGLKLDLSHADGLPAGGLAVTEELADMKLVPVIHTLDGGQPVELDLPPGTLHCLGAWPPAGPPVDLASMVVDGKLRWNAPAGSWRIYGAVGHSPASAVEGSSSILPAAALDPFSAAAARSWCDRFTAATALYNAAPPRAQVFDLAGNTAANWTPDFFAAFEQRRGYDLREQLPALFGDGEGGQVERVLCDYRETLADLRRESLVAWHHWTASQGSLSRARITGSTGNPLDLATVPDIPTVFIEGPLVPDDLPMIGLVASAAHLGLKPLIAADVFSGLGEHFAVTPAALKQTTDLLFLSGVNHLVANGITASPDGADWPGWLHPAATGLGPGSGLWRELPAFNAYVTRCQSILQSGAPDPDVLLYYPAHDFWTERGGIPDDPDERARWLRPTAFHRAAMDLWDGGVGCDFVSDRLLTNAAVANGRIILGGLSYQTLILPEVRRLPENTARKLLELTRLGARIAILGDWPQDVPGFPMPDIRRGNLFSSLQQIPSRSFAEGGDAVAVSRKLGVVPEPMAAHGLRHIRRHHADGRHYFIVNRSGRRVDAWIPLASPAAAAVLMDPNFPERAGVAPVRESEHGIEVHFVLEADESRFLRTFYEKKPDGADWRELTPSAPARLITGTWKLDFLDGGPDLPTAREIPILGSWTTLPDSFASAFSGTAAYGIDFEIPADADESWLLDLGEVAHSARVTINGKDAGSSFAPPHQFDISRLIRAGANTLRIEVTNLSANRAADLHRRGRVWHQFANAAFLNPDGLPYHPADDPPRASGLLGPVRLIPLQK